MNTKETPIAETQWRQSRGIAQRLVNDPIDGPVQARTERRHNEEHQRDRQSDQSETRVGRRRNADSKEIENRQPHNRAEHEQIAVSKVDQLDDPVDHRVAERDQREQTPRTSSPARNTG